MCDTVAISNKIIRLGTASFRQRMEVVAKKDYSAVKLSRLNKELSSFYRILYSQINTVTSQDYEKFGQQFEMLLDSIEDLYKTCKKMPYSATFSEETEKLGMNYAALYELNSDIVNFRLKSITDSEISSLMRKSTSLLRSYAR